jgi:hypothetical protein
MDTSADVDVVLGAFDVHDKGSCVAYLVGRKDVAPFIFIPSLAYPCGGARWLGIRCTCHHAILSIALWFWCMRIVCSLGCGTSTEGKRTRVRSTPYCR